MIFVNTCAYRDSQLLPSILDCISKSKWPNDLRFGICNQSEHSDSSLSEFSGDSRFKVDQYNWQESQGLGWARSKAQQFYGGEEFSLQLDSHVRFAKDWDEELIKMVELTGHPKPLIGTYAGVFDPEKPEVPLSPEPLKMVAQEFTPSGTIKMAPAYIEGWKDLKAPIKARFCSGHYTFGPGSWHDEYKFDPEIFFAGEEISMAIRSFTMGFGLYHPHKAVVWHEYMRKHRSKVWDDHVAKNDLLPWSQRDAVSKKRIRKLLQEEDNDADLGQFGLGTVRTHREYELYAGINFSKRTLHKDATTGVEPPCGFDGTEIDPDKDSTYYALEDGKGNVIHKMFLTPGHEAKKLVVWERSKSRGWGERRDFKI